MSGVVTIRLSQDLHQKLKKLAYRKETSMNKLAVELIEKAVDTETTAEEPQEELVGLKPR